MSYKRLDTTKVSILRNNLPGIDASEINADISIMINNINKTVLDINEIVINMQKQLKEMEK
jgi:hypothetical protein